MCFSSYPLLGSFMRFARKKRVESDDVRVFCSLLCIFRDQPLFSEEELHRIKVIYTLTISALAKKANLRQRVAATAIVYFKRFYVRNSVRDHDPRLIAPVSLVSATATLLSSFPASPIVTTNFIFTIVLVFYIVSIWPQRLRSIHYLRKFL